MARPCVFVNMAVTLDGKIAAADRDSFALGSGADRREMDRLRAEADIVLWGGQTLRSARGPARVRDPGLAASREASGRPAQPANGVVTASGDISIGLKWFEAPGIARFVFTGAAGAPAARQAARGRAEVVVLDEGEVSASALLDALAQRGMEKVLLEGGGGLHWMFAREGLLDVLHVTLTPWLAGGASAPTLLDGAGFPAGQFLRLKLEEVREEGEEMFLRYRVLGSNTGGPPAR